MYDEMAVEGVVMEREMIVGRVVVCVGKMEG